MDEQGRSLGSRLAGIQTKLLTCLQIGVQEAVCHMLSIRLSVGSRSVIYVDTNLPWDRVRATGKPSGRRQTHPQNEDPTTATTPDVGADEDMNEIEALLDGWPEHYLKRNRALSSVCFAEYCMQYTWMSREK